LNEIIKYCYNITRLFVYRKNAYRFGVADFVRLGDQIKAEAKYVARTLPTC
jgi:hypothetical protein